MEQKADKKGIDLDLIDLSEIEGLIKSNKSEIIKEVKKPEGNKSDKDQKIIPKPEIKPSVKKRINFKIVLFVFILGISAIIITFLIFININSKQKQIVIQDNYINMGPIISEFDDKQKISLTFDIDCKNVDIKKKVSGEKSVIRNRILSFIGSKKGVDLIRKKDFNSLKLQIISEINGIIGGGSIDEIYFTEMITY